MRKLKFPKYNKSMQALTTHMENWALPPLRSPDWHDFVQDKLNSAKTLLELNDRLSAMKVLGVVSLAIAAVSVIVFACLGAIALPAVSGLAVSMLAGCYLCFQYRRIQKLLKTLPANMTVLPKNELLYIQMVATKVLVIPPTQPHEIEQDLLDWETQRGCFNPQSKITFINQDHVFKVHRNLFTNIDCWILANNFYRRLNSHLPTPEAIAQSRIYMHEDFAKKALAFGQDVKIGPNQINCYLSSAPPFLP